jgi:hypothetical protein
MNKALQRKIVLGFERTDLTVCFGDGWVNVARPDGIHAEFYPCYGDGYPEDVLTATYTVDGIETEIDMHVPSQIDEFVEICEKILYSPELPELGECVADDSEEFEHA